MKKKFALYQILILFLLVACSSQQTAVTETAEPLSTELTGVIVIGDIDADDPISKIERFQPVADYLAANLSEFGIGRGEVRIASDSDTMANWMESGEVDIYYDSLFPAMIVSDQSGAIPTLRRWKNGSPTYHSVFFAREDSGIETLADLEGQIIGYDEQGSTSGYLLPTAYLLTNGFSPVERLSSDASVGDNEIGYMFTNDDDNTIEWVLSGSLAAGVVDNLTYLDEIPEATRIQLVVLGETQEVARQIVLMSPTLTPEIRDAVTELLANLTETQEGLEILSSLKTDRFDTFPEGAENALETMRGFYDIVVNSEE